ncbi:MAG TPA: 23S rRNA (guanosine(2251)-2'-O)-methyltransferase RlmB [Bacillota bacterium]|nr:23S rRNA (guanosine(2251)-2'-O)-methyltransferase RlmB [Bacillota bacterium]HOL16107.1 23S rRNA (guanosine(2251)-2'-O)-methyltransferase RlmB [Bacillota bacterium]
MKIKRRPELPGKDDLVIGRRPVLEALRSGSLQQVYLAAGQKGEIIDQISREARSQGLPLEVIPRRELHRLTDGGNHQGVAAQARPFPYLKIEELLEKVYALTGAPFLILLDHLQDPQNLGSLMRTAEVAGMDGIIIPQDRSVKITPAVRKVAAGAAERLPVARVVNLVDAVRQLKKEGFWVYGTAADGPLPYYRADYRVPFVLVIGSEGKGISRLLRESCDGIISIPMRGPGGSLNAAVAAAVIIYAAAAQREGWGLGKPESD